MLSDGERRRCVAAASREQLHDANSPESEGGSSCEEHRLGLELRFLKEAEEGVVFNADLPKDFAAIPAAHQKLQSVLI